MDKRGFCTPRKESSSEVLTRKVIGGISFVLIPRGKFLMGSRQDDPQAFDNERPQHILDISYDYWIGRFPVTNEQFATFVHAESHRTTAETEGYGRIWSLEMKQWVKISGADWRHPTGPKSDIDGIGDHPVVQVSWFDALAYCRWSNRLYGRELPHGLAFCLPGENEWEKAARGEKGNVWPWGDEWQSRRCNSLEAGPGFTTPAGAYSPDGDSPYGAANMAGNVWEWTRSLWGPNADIPAFKYPYDRSDGRENPDAALDILRVLRGGSFGDDEARYVRCAYRDRLVPDFSYDYLGFRVAVAPSYRADSVTPHGDFQRTRKE